MPALPFLIMGFIFFFSFAMSNQKEQIVNARQEIKNFVPRIEPVFQLIFNTSFLRELQDINLLRLRVEEFRRY